MGVSFCVFILELLTKRRRGVRIVITKSKRNAIHQICEVRPTILGHSDNQGRPVGFPVYPGEQGGWGGLRRPPPAKD